MGFANAPTSGARDASGRPHLLSALSVLSHQSIRQPLVPPDSRCYFTCPQAAGLSCSITRMHGCMQLLLLASCCSAWPRATVAVVAVLLLLRPACCYGRHTSATASASLSRTRGPMCPRGPSLPVPAHGTFVT
jgi:hypothetical protein